MRSTLLLSLLGVAVVGCGDHGLPPPVDMAMLPDDIAMPADLAIPEDARSFVTFTKFAQDLAQALCAHAVTCGQLDAAQMPACLERNLRHTGWDQDVEITKDRMQINELQCLAAVQASRCDQSDSGFVASRCLQFLYEAHQANGAACLSNVECTSGFCQHGGSDGGATEQVTGCPGVCASPKGTGVTCRQDSDCATDSYCDAGGTNTCLKAAALNQDCSAIPCQLGLLCPTFPATQTTLHGACDPFQGALTPTVTCGAGMYCQLQYSASTACTVPADCTQFGSFCDTTAGMCQVPSGGKCETKIASAAVCDPHNDGFYAFVDDQCADGTSCYQLSGQTGPSCQPFGASGAPCLRVSGQTDTCKVGLYCNATTVGAQGTCMAWIPDGQACSNAGPQPPHCTATPSSSCVAANSDAGGATTCQVTRSFGEPCAPGFEDSLCAQSDTPGSTYCAPTGASGVCSPKCF